MGELGSYNAWLAKLIQVLVEFFSIEFVPISKILLRQEPFSQVRRPKLCGLVPGSATAVSLVMDSFAVMEDEIENSMTAE